MTTFVPIFGRTGVRKMERLIDALGPIVAAVLGAGLLIGRVWASFSGARRIERLAKEAWDQRAEVLLTELTECHEGRRKLEREVFELHGTVASLRAAVVEMRDILERRRHLRVGEGA